MPSQRAPGQRLINIPMREVFITEIDRALPKLDYSDRSKFIRDAVKEKLCRMGWRIPDELALEPGRAGKGGRRKVLYPKHRSAAWGLNEK